MNVVYPFAVCVGSRQFARFEKQIPERSEKLSVEMKYVGIKIGDKMQERIYRFQIFLSAIGAEILFNRIAAV